MKNRFWALLAAVALVVSLALNQSSEARVRTYDLSWRNTVGVGPASATQHPSGFIDSTWFSGTAARFDTSVAFNFVDIARSNIALTLDTLAVSFSVSIYPRPGGAGTGGVTESGVLIDLQVSGDGATWTSVLAGADSLSHKPTEVGTNQLFSGYNSRLNFPGTNTELNRTAWWGYPLYRLLVRGDLNGEWDGVLRYFVDD